MVSWSWAADRLRGDDPDREAHLDELPVARSRL
jgi:hypothetical protein